MTEFLRFTITAELHEDRAEELPEMLRQLAARLEEDGMPVPHRWGMRDANGNTLGHAHLDDAGEPEVFGASIRARP